MEKDKLKGHLNHFLVHNAVLYTDEENLKWCWLRAVEWGQWPLFTAQVVAPTLFLFFSWWQVAITVVILNWLWLLICYKYVNVTLAGLGPFFIILKWPVSIGIAVYFLIQVNYLLAAVSGFWPVITLFLMFLSPPIKTGIIQTALMNRLGYKKMI